MKAARLYSGSLVTFLPSIMMLPESTEKAPAMALSIVLCRAVAADDRDEVAVVEREVQVKERGLGVHRPG